ncbi:MAG: Hsp20/alpha crystallin family protein, partial [bacterium]
MKIIRHSHPSDFDQFNHVMESLWGSRQSPLNAPMDVFEKDSILTVRALMPGVTPENLEVTFENSTLSIKGKVERQELSEAKVYQLETATGTFSRTLRLAGRWDVDGIKASLENGVVTVTVPR